MGYALRITRRAVEVVSGADQTPGIVAAESSGVKAGLRSKWGGGELRARPQSGRMVRQGNGWVLEGGGSNSGSPAYGGGGSFTSTPGSATFVSPGVPSPYLSSPFAGPGTPSLPVPHSAGQQATGLGLSPSTFHPAPDTPGHEHLHMRPPRTTQTNGGGEDQTGGVNHTMFLPGKKDE